MTQQPLISIVIPCYNYAGYVATAIRSVLEQTYPNWQLIVVDNGSTDHSLSEIRAFDDPRMEVIALPRNAGLVNAWLEGLGRCRGPWHAMLPADDFFLPHKLERQVAELERHPELTALAGYLEVVDAGGNPIPESQGSTQHFSREYNQPFEINHWENWLWRHRILLPTALYRTDWIRRYGIAEGYQTAADWELHLRLLRHGARIAVLPEKLVAYRWHGRNQSDPAKTPFASILVEMAYGYATQFVPWMEQLGTPDCGHHALASLLEIIPPCPAFPEEAAARVFAAVLHPEALLRQYRDFSHFRTAETAEFLRFPGVPQMIELRQARATMADGAGALRAAGQFQHERKELRASREQIKQKLNEALLELKRSKNLLNYHRANPIRALKLWWGR